MQNGQPDRPIRLLVADDIGGIVSTIEKLSSFTDRIEPCGMALDAGAVVTEAERLHPDVILLNPELGEGDGRSLIEAVATAAPQSRIFVLSNSDPAPPGQRIVPRNASGLELVTIVSELRVAGAGAVPTVELEPIRPLSPRPPRRSAPGRGEIVLVFAGKGGVGKSMVAANLAVGLGLETQQRVALLDLDLQFGDVALMLGIEGHDQSMEALAHHGELVDADVLDSVMVSGPAGIRALLAPPAPELAELVTPVALRGILREVARAHDIIVIDGPAHLDEQTLEVIEIADHILVVTSSSVAAVKDTRIMLRLLRSLGVDLDRVSIVLNHTRARSTLLRQDIEERLRHRVRLELPFEHRIVDDAVDRGTPFVVGEPESEIAGRFSWLVRFLSNPGTAAAPEAPRPQRTHAFRRRFSIGRREQPA